MLVLEIIYDFIIKLKRIIYNRNAMSIYISEFFRLFPKQEKFKILNKNSEVLKMTELNKKKSVWEAYRFSILYWER